MTVDIWLWRLDLPAAEAEPLARLLSEDEQARAARLLRPRDRARFTAARGGMRRVLGACLGAPPAALEFGFGPAGKPALAGGPRFNLSHSGGQAALAVLAEAPHGSCLGLDIEAVRDLAEPVAERFFAPAEVAALAAVPALQQAAGFFRLWTRKEAVIKAMGSGLAGGLDGFAVSLAPDAARLLSAAPGMGPADDWSLAGFSPAQGLEGAVAVRGTDGAPLRLRLRRGLPPAPRPG